MLEHTIPYADNFEGLMKQEWEWISQLLNGKVKEVDCLRNQFAHAKVIRRQEYSYISGF